MKPLAIDLFSGLDLSQAQFSLRADATVQQSVACRAEYPDHRRFSVFHLSPYSISFVLWSVRELKDATLAAGLTSSRQRRISAAHSGHYAGFMEAAAQVVTFLCFRISAVESPALLLGRLLSAPMRAIPSIAVWIHYFKMLPAAFTIAAATSDIRLFLPPDATSPRLTFDRAVALVGTFSSEPNATT